MTEEKKGFFAEMRDGAEKIAGNFVLFLDEHPNLVKYGTGAVIAAATIPLTPIASVVTGAVAAFAVDQAQGFIHETANDIRKKRSSAANDIDHAKQNEQGKGMGLENSKEHQQSQEFEPLSKERQRSAISAIRYHDHHLEDAKSRAASAGKDQNARAA